MVKICVECGQVLRARADAKFCSAHCRSSYHNKKRIEDNAELIRKVNSILRKNRKILKTLNPEGKSKITKSKLEKSGFNFNYITNIYETKNGKEYKFCYDMGYVNIGDDWFMLVAKYDYV